jgi:hypothetical protein
VKIRGNRIYDEYGQLQGKVRDSGRVVDQYGQVKGKIRDSGRVVDENGQQLGKVRNHKIYDEYGQPMEPDVLFGDD